MKILTYKYDDDYKSDLIEENSSLTAAIENLKKEVIDFFEIHDDETCLEITLSTDGEIITNGYVQK